MKIANDRFCALSANGATRSQVGVRRSLIGTIGSRPIFGQIDGIGKWNLSRSTQERREREDEGVWREGNESFFSFFGWGKIAHVWVNEI